MKLLLVLGAFTVACFARSESLPSITVQPTNQAVLPNGTANLSVDASGATTYQWRFNGIDIPNATNPYLQVTNVQTTNTGYYVVVVKNSTGWVPSQLVYLSIARPAIDPNAGWVPFSNYGSPNGPALDACSPSYAPISTGTAQIVAGPELDQMQPIGITTSVSGGYFSWIDQKVPTVAMGQSVYYKVVITHPCSFGGGSLAQGSTILKLVASDPSASIDNLKFPVWPEWGQDPSPFPTYSGGVFTPTNQTRLAGETFTLTNDFFAYSDFGTPKGQWRKDGALLPNATNFTQLGFAQFRSTLTISNVQPGDAGVYEVQVLGNNWIIGPKTSLSVQTTNANSVILSPRWNGSNFLADLQGLSGRYYNIQWSSNLVDWNTLQTVLNVTGTVTFSNAPADPKRFYRALFLP